MSDSVATASGADVAGAAASASGLVLLTLASSQFLMTLDSSVMNVSIATVAEDVERTSPASRRRSRSTRS